MWNVLRPCGVKLLTHYRENSAEYVWIANTLRTPKIPAEDMLVLAKAIGEDGARLVASVARLQNYGDPRKHAERRRDVSLLLRQRGVRLRRGKRTRPELEALIETMAPLLIQLGLPVATSERSRLVKMLRLIADAFGVQGDPRDTLRTALKRDREQTRRAQILIREAMATAWLKT
jgi:hypothetical protein